MKVLFWQLCLQNSYWLWGNNDETLVGSFSETLYMYFYRDLFHLCLSYYYLFCQFFE